jgi:hypothetical protein
VFNTKKNMKAKDDQIKNRTRVFTKTVFLKADEVAQWLSLEQQRIKSEHDAIYNITVSKQKQAELGLYMCLILYKFVTSIESKDWSNFNNKHHGG